MGAEAKPAIDIQTGMETGWERGKDVRRRPTPNNGTTGMGRFAPPVLRRARGVVCSTRGVMQVMRGWIQRRVCGHQEQRQPSPCQRESRWVHSPAPLHRSTPRAPSCTGLGVYEAPSTAPMNPKLLPNPRPRPLVCVVPHLDVCERLCVRGRRWRLRETNSVCASSHACAASTPGGALRTARATVGGDVEPDGRLGRYARRVQHSGGAVGCWCRYVCPWCAPVGIGPCARWGARR